MRRVLENPNQYLNEEEAHVFIHESAHFFMRMGEKRVVKRLLAEFGHLERLHVLDVGSGPGWITTAIAEKKKDWSLTGLDASPVMLEHGRKLSTEKNIPVEWVHGFADKTGLPDNAFSLVYSSLAFHEFPDPRAALREFLRVLKKGGSIIICDLLRPSRLGMIYYQWVASLIYFPVPIFRRQFLHSLQSAFEFNELKNILDEMQADYLLKAERHFGTRIFILEIKKT